MLRKIKLLLFLSISALVLSGVVIYFWPSQDLGVAAVNPITVSFSGDDYNVNGGIDDPYDSFLVLNPQSNYDHFISYQLNYSGDGGQHWQDIPADVRSATTAVNYSPVLYWDFEEGNGATIHNQMAADTVTLSGSYSWLTSIFNHTVNFTGGSLSSVSAGLIKPDAGAISFWIYPTDINKQLYIFRYCTDGGCNSNNRLYFRIEPTGGATLGISNVVYNFPGGTIVPNTWQHFIITYGTNQYYVYKNGTLLNQGAFNAFNINDSITVVPLVGGASYQGYLDELKIFNVYLNTTQVTNEYAGINNQQSNFSYYWPLNNLGNQDLTVRVGAKTARGVFYTQPQTIRIRHRFGSRGRNYFVENFLTPTWEGVGSGGFWNAVNGTLRFSNQTVNCPVGPIQAFSSDILAGLGARSVVTNIVWQAAQRVENNSSIFYEFSTDGINWQSGLTVTTTSVTSPQTIVLNKSASSLYWRATLTRGNSCSVINQPAIYSLRFSWEYNHTPRACLEVSPTRSNNPNQVFAFDANCSSDVEDDNNNLIYQWDFNNDGQWDGQGRSLVHTFGTTTQQTILLKVTDSFNASGTFSQNINPPVFLSGRVNGWGWSPIWGWISLNCENIYNGVTAVLCARNGQGQSDYGLSVDELDFSLKGYAWSSSLGWLCFGKTCFDQGVGQTPDNQDPYLFISVADGSLSGWAKAMSMGEEGWLRFDNPENRDFNVRFNTSTQSLDGYAWGIAQASVNREYYGIGPIDFSRSFTSYPWLETKYGNIYSLRGLGSANMAAAPSSSISAAGLRYNATYCLLTNGDIVNFKTQSRNCQRAQYTPINFPQPNNNFQTPLGFLPLSDLHDQAINSNTLVEVSDLSAYFGAHKVLDNKVYYFTGSDQYTISNIITFLNNVSLNGNGAGTIVIDGDLRIDANLFYDDSQLIGKIGNLASVAFVVLGDVKVMPTVNHLVGSWLILGNTTNQQCLNGALICGQFSTGDDTALPTQFTLQGMVLAKKFNLERTFRQGVEPAEQFIYDGRVNVNTPPGLSNVSFNLPSWNSQ